jgi:hypothetical protein
MTETNNTMKKKLISTDDVEAWLGSDNTLEQAIEIIADIANGVYKPKDLKQEVSDYSDE